MFYRGTRRILSGEEGELNKLPVPKYLTSRKRNMVKLKGLKLKNTRHMTGL